MSIRKYLVFFVVVLFICPMAINGQERLKMEKVFSISSRSASFGAKGGTKSFTITSSESWKVSTWTSSWGHLSKNGNTLTLVVDENTAATSRSDSFVLSSGNDKIQIDITQEAATYLSVSSETLRFDASGGTKSITVFTNGEWVIGTGTASWGHLSRNGNQLSIRIDPYSGTKERTGWFSVKADNKEKRISITQSASTAAATTLSLSTYKLNFTSSGGTRTITVSTNTTWRIGTNTASWGHLSKNGNQLTIRVDPHSGTKDRTDWFTIKAGDKEKRVDISQSALSTSASNTNPQNATIKSVTVLNNADVDGEKGLLIKVTFSVSGMKGKKGNVACYFYDLEGNALLDKNKRYYTNQTPSHVAVSRDITPGYDNTNYNEYELKIPYSELHLADNTSRTLRIDVEIWDCSVSPNKSLAKKGNTNFSFSPTIDYLRVDDSITNQTRYFNSNGGRETFKVNTSATTYETWGVPSWCSIENRTKNSFTLVCSSNPYNTSRSDYMKVKAAGKEVRIDISQEAKKGGKKIKQHSDPWLRIGLDLSMDFFMRHSYDDYSPYYSTFNDPDHQICLAAGLRARIGRPDNLFNLIGGARYVFAGNYSGIMIPAILNLNLIRGDSTSIYLGGGYEFAAMGAYKSDAIIQTGVCGKHADLQLYYKPASKAIGVGISVYF